MDVYKIARGSTSVAHWVWITIHLTVIVSGALLLRRATGERQPAR